MNGFDELSERGQVQRLRRCSGQVLQEYGISDPTLTLLAHHRQTTFRIQSSMTSQRYVFRFHRSTYRNPAAVRSEFRWLRSLREETNVMVPEPLATLDGEDVPRISADGLPEDLHCSLTTWLEGKRYFRKHGPGVRVLRHVGRIMATMHRHAEGFRPSEWLQCPVWNWERLFTPRAPETGNAERRMLDTEGHRLFRETEQRARAAMDMLGTGREEFGLIHGDLIQANYIIHRGDVRVIDFADFGYGHFLYDIGITLFGLWGLDEDQQQRTAFLSGYREVRPLDPRHAALLDLFIAARAVVQARFVMGSKHPADQRMAPRYIRRVIDGLKLWLSGKNESIG